VVASVKRASLWIELLPLLRREFRLSRIELREPKLTVERDPEGKLNVDRLKAVATLLGALRGGSLSLSEGTLVYADRKSELGFEATHCDLVVSRIGLATANPPRSLRDLSLVAGFTCGEIRTKNFTVSGLKVSVGGKDGIFELQPITMGIFGGQATGSLRADVLGPVPVYQVRCSLPRFRIEEFLKILSPQKAVEGAMDFSASLSMEGMTGSQLVQSAAGEISMRGEHLTLVGNDLDAALSRFESSQSFNLVDLGAVFLAGPVGLAVTRGYDFASIFRGSGGTSSIRTLVSNWRVEGGVARAKDVALATTKNRIALQGGLDFVHNQFAEVTVAKIDAQGCARVRQVLRGSFEKPTVEKPRVLTSLAGPVLRLYRQTRRLFPSGPCEVFYSGSVAPPR
jgi:AsmA-like protein